MRAGFKSVEARNRSDVSEPRGSVDRSGGRITADATKDKAKNQSAGALATTCKNITVAAKPPTKVGSVLTRSTFVTSRLADFASTEELTRQIGHAPASWPIVILKELVDNAFDECERAGVAPEIAINVADDSILGQRQRRRHARRKRSSESSTTRREPRRTPPM